MSKKLLEILMVGVVVAGVVGAYFKWMGALPIAVTQTQKSSTFDVSGEGKVVVVPDQASLQLGVSAQGRSLKQVQESINSRMQELSSSLRKLGVDEGDIQTTAYNYYPDYMEKGLYRAQASVKVIVRDLDQVSPILDLVSGLGLDSVSSPTFELSDDLREQSMKEARVMAIDKARAKAEELAKLSGMNLGRIVNVDEGEMSSWPMPLMGRELAVDSVQDLKAPTPVEVGSSEVAVVVTLSYETR